MDEPFSCMMPHVHSYTYKTEAPMAWHLVVGVQRTESALPDCSPTHVSVLGHGHKLSPCLP